MITYSVANSLNNWNEKCKIRHFIAIVSKMKQVFFPVVSEKKKYVGPSAALIREVSSIGAIGFFCFVFAVFLVVEHCCCFCCCIVVPFYHRKTALDWNNRLWFRSSFFLSFCENYLFLRIHELLVYKRICLYKKNYDYTNLPLFIYLYCLRLDRSSEVLRVNENENRKAGFYVIMSHPLR